MNEDQMAAAVARGIRAAQAPPPNPDEQLRDTFLAALDAASRKPEHDTLAAALANSTPKENPNG